MLTKYLVVFRYCYIFVFENIINIYKKRIDMSKTHHDLKISPKYYRDIESNEKTFEVRFNDRDFKVGDIVNYPHLKGGASCFIDMTRSTHRRRVEVISPQA